MKYSRHENRALLCLSNYNNQSEPASRSGMFAATRPSLKLIFFLLILDNDSSGKLTRCREKRHLNWMFFLSICRKPLRFYVEKELINLFSLLVWNFEPSKCKTAWNQQKEWTRLKHPKQRKRTKYQCKTWKVFIFSFFHVVTWFGIDLPGELL